MNFILVVGFVYERKELITFHQDMFPPDSLGCAVFPKDLEGRQRQKSTITRPLTAIIPRQSILRALEKIGIQTLPGLLALPPEELEPLASKQQTRVTERVSYYFNRRILIGPEEFFLSWLFKVEPKPVPLEFEPEQQEKVREVLQSLDIVTQTNLPKDLLLEHPLLPELSLYASFGEDAIGRELWGVDFGCEINKLYKTIDIADLLVQNLNLQGDYSTGILAHSFTTPLSLFLRQPYTRLHKVVRDNIKNRMGNMDNGLLP